MEDLLSTEQILLLENLMYLSDQEPFLSIQSCGAYTVEEWIEDIDISQIKKSSD